MSSINPTGIAGSVSQSIVQQKQVAKAQDARRNEKELLARKLREEAEKHARAVEDSTETSDQTMQVRGEQRHDEQHDRKRRDPRQTGYPETPDADGHVDLEA